jgi:hypothetical protein
MRLMVRQAHHEVFGGLTIRSKPLKNARPELVEGWGLDFRLFKHSC